MPQKVLVFFYIQTRHVGTEKFAIQAFKELRCPSLGFTKIFGFVAVESCPGATVREHFVIAQCVKVEVYSGLRYFVAVQQNPSVSCGWRVMGDFELCQKMFFYIGDVLWRRFARAVHAVNARPPLNSGSDFVREDGACHQVRNRLRSLFI